MIEICFIMFALNFLFQVYISFVIQITYQYLHNYLHKRFMEAVVMVDVKN